MTTDLDAKFPEVLYNRNLHDEMSDLVHEPWSPFKGRTQADLFVFAMAYAFSQGVTRKPLDPNPMKLPPYAFDVEKRTLMRSLAIHVKNDIRVIKDNNEVITICAEYANAAIKYIHTALRNKPSEKTSEDILEEFVSAVGK